MNKLFFLTINLFALMDSIGNVPLFSTLLSAFSPQEQKKIIIREMLIALLFMFVFYFIGDGLMKALHLSLEGLMISGAILLFMIAIKMLFPSKEMNTPQLKKQPFIVPMAIPLITGPAIISNLMIYRKTDSVEMVISALVLAWLLSLCVLMSSIFLKSLIGEKGLLACERLVGLLLTFMATQMFLDGLKLYLKTI
ncbi:MAG: MarC family protein [Rhabdochlamydiaceae bacterium]